MCPEDSPRFIVDINVGKLARWLRMIGYDTHLFDHRDDKHLIHIALTENRIILTRDTQMMKRRVITIGELKALLITSDNPGEQIHQVIKELGLNPNFNPFSLCLECNQPLVKDKQRRCRRSEYRLMSTGHNRSMWNAPIATAFTGRVPTGRRWLKNWRN